jgi:hypothetical protein
MNLYIFPRARGNAGFAALEDRILSRVLQRTAAENGGE